jgi:predicted metal-dependent HD superfamily phosphohydrolase
MTAPEVELRTAWHHLAGRAHDPLLEKLLARHREPHRRYHTATHVMWVLRHVSDIVSAGEQPTDLPAVQLAALYHDVVYDPRSTNNEARSAAIAMRAATDLEWPRERCDLVERLVLATVGHVPRDADEAVLVDADLAILGSSPSDYSAYVNGVRAEYAHVSDDAWHFGRAAVLRGFLTVPHLFTTSYMRTAREARARANITAELATLGG